LLLVDLFATRGLIKTLRAAAADTVVPVRVVRDTGRTGATALQPASETSAPSAASRHAIVTQFSPRALDLARGLADTSERDRPTHREPPPRGQRLDILA